VPAAELRQRFAAELGHVTPKVGGEAAIFDDHGRILLVRRADDGRWCLPCGWLEANESPVEAAVRETKEETGLEVRPLALVDVITRKANIGHGPHTAIAVIYLCEIIGGTLQSSHEGLEVRYWRVEEVPAWHELHEQYARVAYQVWQSQQSSPKSALLTGEYLIRGEQLYAMSGIGPSELVKGKIVHRKPSEYTHGIIEAIIGALLGSFSRQHKLGQALSGGIGIYTTYNPDTVRAADIAFISNERLRQAKPKGYLDVAPELVVEVMSPDDTWNEIHEKLEEYFEVGVLIVWVVDPQREEIHVYRSLDDRTRLTTADELTAEDVLPGFRVPVAEIFES
jgi:Uma2 family endonuclease/ADP-ribose pyrophosphatase YjhB (NUDIX family)